MPRASGKTTLLIKESVRTGKPIIVPNAVSARYVEEQAREMRVKIPEPISATSWNSGYYRGSNFNRINGFLIDELDSVLANIFGRPIDKATYTPEKVDVPYYKMDGLKRSELENVLKEIKGYNEHPIIIGLQNLKESVKENINMTMKDMMNKYGYDIDSVDMCSEGTVIHFSKTIPANAIIHNGEIVMPNEVITDINVIVPDKVVEITFGNDQTEKMVCHEDDTFDLRKCCFIAIAKHLYKKEYTYEGIEYMAEQLMYQKTYVKIVDKALKDYKRKEDEKTKKARMEEEERIIRERQKAKRWKQKERRRERQESERNEALKAEREEIVSMIADAINKAKDDRKKRKFM